MIIDLSKSHLFTKDPDMRFSEQYDVPRGLWNLMLNRAKFLDYTVEELSELCQIKTKKVIPSFTVRRWIWRSEVYNKASPFLKRGARTVVSDIFGDLEDDLIKELTKHMKDGATKDSKALI